MRTPSLLRLVALLIAVSVVAVACGGPGSDEDLIEALAAEADLATLPPGLDEGDVDCMAGAMVSAMGGAEGADSKYGITVDEVGSMDDVDLSTEDATQFVENFGDCVDLKSLLATSMASEGLDQEIALCVLDEVPDDLLNGVFAEQFSDGQIIDPEDFAAAMSGAAAVCAAGG